MRVFSSDAHGRARGRGYAIPTMHFLRHEALSVCVA